MLREALSPQRAVISERCTPVARQAAAVESWKASRTQPNQARLFSGAGQLYKPVTNQLWKAGGILTYDNAGNLVTKAAGGWSYGYDALERLVSVRQAGVLIARYGYDVAGRRVVKRVYSGATGGTVGYLRMGYAGAQVAFETDSANTSLSTLYTWGPGVDQLVGVRVSGTDYTVVTDPLGSVRALVRRSDGVWVGRLAYDPYGQLLDSAGPQPPLRYRWTGREWDAETGFYFHRTRVYDPAVGRFVQEDRAGYGGGGNLYAYVEGNVLQARDPEGLMADYPFNSWRGLCIGDYCFGDIGDPGPTGGGGSAGARRSAALSSWGAGTSQDFDAGYSLVTFADGTTAWIPGSVSACKNGSCPGGLSEAQYERILLSIQEMTAYGGRRINELLQAGRISSASWIFTPGVDRFALGWVNPGQAPPRSVYLNSDFYKAGAAFSGDVILNASLYQLASTLLHESWHISQLGDMGPADATSYYQQFHDMLERASSMHSCAMLRRPGC